jgi:hypothetical protein
MRRRYVVMETAEPSIVQVMHMIQVDFKGREEDLSCMDSIMEAMMERRVGNIEALHTYRWCGARRSLPPSSLSSSSSSSLSLSIVNISFQNVWQRIKMRMMRRTKNDTALKEEKAAEDDWRHSICLWTMKRPKRSHRPRDYTHIISSRGHTVNVGSETRHSIGTWCFTRMKKKKTIMMMMQQQQDMRPEDDDLKNDPYLQMMVGKTHSMTARVQSPSFSSTRQTESSSSRSYRSSLL